MDLIIRRSPIVTKAESEETLAEAINGGYVHALLYQCGEVELADLLAAHVRPQEARELAWHLREFVRKATRTSIFRDYRTRLSPADARAIGLAATWYERAGAAGCRTWADLREGMMHSGPLPQPLQLLPQGTTGRPSTLDATPQATAASMMDDPEGSSGIMPAWLQAPEMSVWRR